MGKAAKRKKNIEVKKLRRTNFLREIMSLDDDRSYMVQYKGSVLRDDYLPGIYWKHYFEKKYPKEWDSLI